METAIEVRGKAYTLAVTVQAYAELSELCPGKDFSRIGEIVGKPSGDALMITAKMLAIMSKASEQKKRFENPDYTMDPLKEEAVATLSLPEYIKLYEGFGKALQNAMGNQTVQVESEKKTKKLPEKP